MAWGSRKWVAPVLALALVGLLARGAGAEPGVGVEVTVVRASDAAGGVDPGARRVERYLRGQIAYESLRVLKTSQKRLGADEIWKVKIPGAGPLVLRPVDVGPKGTLLAVDWEGVVQGDFRVRPGSPLIFGGPREGDGKLVVVVDTR